MNFVVMSSFLNDVFVGFPA